MPTFLKLKTQKGAYVFLVLHCAPFC